MPTINQLPVLNTISSGDQLPVYSPNNGDARRTSIGSLLTFFQQSFASPTLSVNLYVPGSGFNITVPTPVSNDQWMLLQPAGTLATGTITLPLNTGVPDGTTVLITTTQEITSLTIALNGATALYGGVTSLSAGTATAIRFYQPTNSWYQINAETVYAAGMQAFLATPSSANLRAAMTDETGTGVLVFATSPTLTTPTITNPTVSTGTFTSPALVTPAIGVATGTSLTATGAIVSTGTAGVGYATGAGGTVTQLTSRTTSVTLDKRCGAITMFSAAGSATAATFTVTNSTVGANDVIILNQASGTNLYDLLVTAVAAGSFNITFLTTGGTATDAPVINFAVIDGVAS
jgi:hypothetical protein